jgi:MerR family copper efflux transcriptional regulator
VEELRFLARAREVGFDLGECRQLLELQRDRYRRSRHARELVLEKSQQLQLRIEQLQAMQRVLQDLASRCKGDEGPDCAILEDLAGAAGTVL